MTTTGVTSQLKAPTGGDERMEDEGLGRHEKRGKKAGGGGGWGRQG
jgi:hypothetical protein